MMIILLLKLNVRNSSFVQRMNVEKCLDMHLDCKSMKISMLSGQWISLYCTELRKWVAFTACDFTMDEEC
uniref:Uncharacterized protein n=1 Tax=Cucumis melo TaxID=3656 RepID=A0A9I9E9K5_CUCME